MSRRLPANFWIAPVAVATCVALWSIDQAASRWLAAEQVEPARSPDGCAAAVGAEGSAPGGATDASAVQPDCARSTDR